MAVKSKSRIIDSSKSVAKIDPKVVADAFKATPVFSTAGMDALEVRDRIWRHLESKEKKSGKADKAFCFEASGPAGVSRINWTCSKDRLSTQRSQRMELGLATSSAGPSGTFERGRGCKSRVSLSQASAGTIKLPSHLGMASL